MSGQQHKSSLEQESLFSLELVVDQLMLHSITCRFPAVAFRLLDYPSVIIYHVEHDLAKTIKTKLALETHRAVPAQIPELKDKNGYYQVKKGKSCLLKLSADHLMQHLSDTPLYVMIIDTYSEVPKLLGSCTVLLDKLMQAVYDDISNYGLSVPSVHGDEGVFKIYNLMGIEIGHVTLGYRLLSLGQGLIPHIPDGVTQLQPAPDKVDTSERKIAEDLVKSDPASTEKYVQAAVSRQFRDVEIQNDKILQNTATTQTKIKKKPKPKPKLLGLNIRDELDDLYITNTECPPPLYFNSETESTMFTTYAANPVHLGVAQATSKHELKEDSDTESCTDTIREEDILEEPVAYQKSAMADALYNLMKKQSLQQGDGSAASRSNANFQKHNISKIASGNQLPLLNALLTEILSLQGLSVAQPSSKQTAAMSKVKSPSTSPRQKTKNDKTEPETEAEFLARLATPKRRPTSPESHKRCVSPTPSSKSWLRQSPLHSSRKTKLEYGLTTTQRLRLAKGNPALLQTMEEQEQKRKEGWRSRQPKKYHVSSDKYVSSNGQLAATHIVDHGKTPPQSNTSSPKHRKPVPTPRHIAKANEEHEQVEAYVKEPSTAVAPFGIERERTMYEDEEFEGISARTSNSQKSIEVHLPRAVNGDEEAEDDTDVESDVEETKSPFGRTKVLSVPKLPEDMLISHSYESMVGDSAEYADDFDNDDQKDTLGNSSGDPGIAKPVGTYPESKEDDVQSFKSARSHVSSAGSGESSARQNNSKHSGIHSPVTSLNSPVAKKRNPFKIPFAKESSLPTSPEPRASQSYNKSMESQSFNNSDHFYKRPKTSPKKMKERLASVRTDSVSSYLPSDSDLMNREDYDDNSSQLDQNYSDEFEDISEKNEDEDDILGNIMPMKQLGLDPHTKPGYTWAPS